MIDLALFQPDIPQNTGTILRLAACLDLRCHIVGPAGFDMSDRALRRAGMDYLDLAPVIRHVSWDRFAAWGEAEARRIILMTTRSRAVYTGFRFESHDILLFGRESEGVPDAIHDAVAARLTIPMARGRRSLNLAVSVGITVGEALRQTAGFPALKETA